MTGTGIRSKAGFSLVCGGYKPDIDIAIRQVLPQVPYQAGMGIRLVSVLIPVYTVSYLD
jgi:hypothetical protein